MKKPRLLGARAARTGPWEPLGSHINLTGGVVLLCIVVFNRLCCFLSFFVDIIGVVCSISCLLGSGLLDRRRDLDSMICD